MLNNIGGCCTYKRRTKNNMVNISTYNPAVGAPSVVNTKAFKIYFSLDS